MVRDSHLRPASTSLIIGWVTLLLSVVRVSTATEGVGFWKHAAAPVNFGMRSAMMHMKHKSLFSAPAHAVSTRTTTTVVRRTEMDMLNQAKEAYLYPKQSKRRLKTYLARLGEEEISTMENALEKYHDDIKLCSFTSSRSASASSSRSPADRSTLSPTSTSNQVILDRKETAQKTSVPPKGGASASAVMMRPLVFWENMICGAISRSIAQTVMHPANCMKTILQSSRDSNFASLLRPQSLPMLMRGAGANFILSVPHGAVNFAILELVRGRMSKIVDETPWLNNNAQRIGPGLDFLSSAVSTITCSVVSTPQMMITDNIMAGNYPNLPKAVQGLSSERGLMGFYSGWWPGLAGKIPSYALTWTLFQQLKAAHLRLTDRAPKDVENSIMGCLASATTVCIMIPMDTIKTRLTTQAMKPNVVPYKGIADCAARILKEEGIHAFYRGLPPRLVSVVPMIGIQFGVYEFMKKVMVSRGEVFEPSKTTLPQEDPYGRRQALEEALMEVAADDEQPFPAPHFRNRYAINGKKKNNNKQAQKKQ